MSEKIVQLNEEIFKGQIKELVRGSVEETLNELLEKEAESLTQAARYERKGRFHDAGYHATGIIAPFASACVAAKLMGDSADVLTNALGICGSLPLSRLTSLVMRCVLSCPVHQRTRIPGQPLP